MNLIKQKYGIGWKPDLCEINMVFLDNNKIYIYYICECINSGRTLETSIAGQWI